LEELICTCWPIIRKKHVRRACVCVCLCVLWLWSAFPKANYGCTFCRYSGTCDNSL